MKTYLNRRSAILRGSGVVPRLGIRLVGLRRGDALACSKKREVEVLLMEHEDERLLEGGHPLV